LQLAQRESSPRPAGGGQQAVAASAAFPLAKPTYSSPCTTTKARTEEDLSFKQRRDAGGGGQRGQGPWWDGSRPDHGGPSKCYVPSNFLARQARDYRLRALVLWPVNAHGRADSTGCAPRIELASFLVRNCENRSSRRHHAYSLSVPGTTRCTTGFAAHESGLLFISRHCRVQRPVHPPSRSLRSVQCPREPIGLSYDTRGHVGDSKASLQLRNLVGQGQFGEVWEGVWNSTTRVAVKTLKPGTMDAKDFLREAQTMKRLRHPNLIQLYAVCTQDEPIYIVTELMKHGICCWMYLQGPRPAGAWAVKDLLFMDRRWPPGWASYSGGPGTKLLLHQTWLPATFYSRRTIGWRRSASFGLARLLKIGQKSTSQARLGSGPDQVETAPEAPFQPVAPSNPDVWSYGILLMELLTYGRSVETATRMPRPSGCPDLSYASCCASAGLGREQRPSFEEIQTPGSRICSNADDDECVGGGGGACAEAAVEEKQKKQIGAPGEQLRTSAWCEVARGSNAATCRAPDANTQMVLRDSNELLIDGRSAGGFIGRAFG
uniref:non-specific protein-tyrosine kinase n=1 Tax=Macrostomum lignano TaxID=282301 RepID=A0A1I8JR08_9PLAT